MAQSTIVLTMPQLVDLSLNSPEVGIVNFTVLHTLLHVILQQVNLSQIQVEFRGNDCERIKNYICSATPGPQLNLTEYSIEDVKGEKKNTKSVNISTEEKGAEDAGEKEKKDSSHPDITNAHGQTKSTVVLVESAKANLSGAQLTVAITKDHFDKLEENVHVLEERLKGLEELPQNSALIEAMRCESGEKTPVLDMFQILNLTKRLDAAELTVGKIATILEDIVRASGVEVDEDAHQEKATQVKKLESAPKGKAPSSGDVKASPSMDRRVGELEKVVFGAETKGGAKVSLDSDIDFDKIDFSQIPPQQAFMLIQQELIKMKAGTDMATQMLRDIEQLKGLMSGDPENAPPEMRLSQVEIKFQECVDQINSLDTMFNRQVSTLQKRISDLEKEFGDVMEKINLGLPAGDGGGEGSELHGKLKHLEGEMETMMDMSNKFMAEKVERQHTLDIMLEQIELLKTVKADKEDLEDALADKADACQVNRKVSFEQFDTVCGDMSKNIEEAIAKLSQQEALWSQALEDIQKEIGNKLDRLELSPLRDFINNKIKSLQERFKTLTALKKEQEAAGTKSKFLRNVNCISCDKDVVMRKEVDSSLFPKPYAMPPVRSMGPYLAYELDQLRKQQKCLPNSKNLNMLENALQTGKAAKSPDHICNRYCGGSHTVTTPQQRVTRMGHFLEQWGPEISPVNDAHVRGTDGKMYKARDDKLLKQLASERPPTPHAEGKLSIHVTPQKTGEQTPVPASPTSPGSPSEKPRASVVESPKKTTSRASMRMSKPVIGVKNSIVPAPTQETAIGTETEPEKRVSVPEEAPVEEN